jgi:biopolymer transport protein ExbB/TolQ
MMKRLKKRSLDKVEKVALNATRFIGSTESLLIHTILFIGSFILYFFGVPFEQILLVVTTIVSLEAIYLSIFIQMSVNRQYRKLHAVARDVEDIQEDVDEIQKDVDEIQKDVDEIQEDVEDIQEEDKAEEKENEEDEEILSRIENTMGKLIEEVMELKKQQQDNKDKK